MSQLEKLLANAARAMGVTLEDLQSIVKRGEQKKYAAGEYLFHESTPRLWAGWVEEGEIEIVCGAQAKVTHLSTLGLGAMVAEGALMDDTPHSTSAFTRNGVTVLQIPLAVWQEVRETKPDIFYRIVARIAQRQSERLRYAADQISGKAGPDVELTAVRLEHDSLGERDVPLSAYFGVQTLRARENFDISGLPLCNFKHFVDDRASRDVASFSAGEFHG